MVKLVGLDLAWKAGKPSGVCVLGRTEVDTTVELVESCVKSPQEWADFLAALGPDVLAAIDAPLAWREACEAERQLAARFSKNWAAPYTARKQFLDDHQITSGPLLAECLRTARFDLDPRSVTPGALGLLAFETYPHAFHVQAFGLEKRILYKKGRVDVRREGLRVYQAHLGAALDQRAPDLARDPAIAGLLDPEAASSRGRELKALEDRLDAITCALAALIAWEDGLGPGDLYGNANEGYIVIPGSVSFAARRPLRTP